ncbi:hypothetical protein BV898_08893 [Hypsibius exemplaris]|uniref:Uncharacterized protein n=1 Tax=Hypsibius exemplaris TaxID=2072580 RepID=A0A1W0WP97_HYPEX|nr:hypothetical protein BV898_08893 [Hypsibius exemplaris]
MSIRRRYVCCDMRLASLEKRYPIGALPVKRSGQRLGQLLDDGLEDPDRPRPDTERTVIEYSLNKRARWRLISALPDAIDRSDDPFASDTSSKDLHVSFILRKWHSSQRIFQHVQSQWTAFAPNVVTVSSTAFSGSIGDSASAKTQHADQNRPNRITTLTRLAEKGFRHDSPAAEKLCSKYRQSLRGASRIRRPGKRQSTSAEDFKSTLSSIEDPVAIMTDGIVYEIGMTHNVSSHFYRKDRHSPRSDLQSREGRKSLKKSKRIWGPGRHGRSEERADIEEWTMFGDPTRDSW